MADLSKLPLSVFDPRMRALLQRGCREYVEVPCPDPRSAQHTRNMLNTFRARMRKEYRDRPDLWEELYGTIIAVRKSRPTVVTLRPRRAEMNAILDPLNLASEESPPANPLEDIAAEMEVENKNGNGDQKT